MRLTIHNLTMEDFTTYSCIAKNSLGETDGSIKLYGEPELFIVRHEITIVYGETELLIVSQTKTLNFTVGQIC